MGGRAVRHLRTRMPSATPALPWHIKSLHYLGKSGPEPARADTGVRNKSARRGTVGRQRPDGSSGLSPAAVDERMRSQ